MGIARRVLALLLGVAAMAAPALADSELDRVIGAADRRFYDASETRLICLGAGHLADENARRYGEDPRHDRVAAWNGGATRAS